MEGYFMAQIMWFAGNFAPQNWSFCQGQLQSISQNTALFALLGTTYGGDGQTTYALPDFRGRIAIGAGQGPGLPSFSLGQQGGVESRTLTIQQMPAHSHPVASSRIAVSSASASSGNPSNAVFGVSGFNAYSPQSAANETMGGVSATVGSAGLSQPLNTVMPYLGLNFVICEFGIFPSRS